MRVSPTCELYGARSWPTSWWWLRATVKAAAAGSRRYARARLLAAFGRPLAFCLERAARLAAGRVGIALVYHRVGDPPGSLDRELLPALGLGLFEAHVRHLTARYRVVPASELTNAARARRRGDRFPVAITFDDDLRSHVDGAAPILTRAEGSATFFLSGASLHAPHRFWWERLQDAVDRGLELSRLGLPHSDGGIHEVGRTIEALPARELENIERSLRTLVGPDPDDAGLRADDVERLRASGFEIGFHTRRHYRLPPLPDDELARAMEEGRGELEDLVGGRLKMIAYPHGHADRRVAAAARTAGFELGFTGSGGPVTSDADPLLLARVSPSYVSVGELAFQVAWTLLRAPSR